MKLIETLKYHQHWFGNNEAKHLEPFVIVLKSKKKLLLF